jgi:Type VI secretion system (T6SS), amidase effector protein 4
MLGAPMKSLPKGAAAFEKMWQAHPHNHQPDETQNISSEALRAQHGLPDYITNTCAVRMSIMLDALGGTILPAATTAAGIARRPHYRPNTRRYYLLGAQEMWTYLTNHFRRPDLVFPARGIYPSEAAFTAAFETTIRPRAFAAKGIVAFEKIFDYQGTGHVDLFDGERLSDASEWYPCQRLRLWLIA